MDTQQLAVRKRTSARVLRWIERVCFTAAALSLGYCAYVVLEAQIYQSYENEALDAMLTQTSAVADAQPAANGPVPRTIPAAGSAIGRIEIPRLQVSAIVRAGSDARTLQLAVGLIPGTALPGEPGNIGLAGHRDTFFRRLRDIRDRDEIRLVTPARTYVYRVERTQVEGRR